MLEHKKREVIAAMKIVLIGAPGAGKGTQAQTFCKTHNIPHISTGDILRKNVKEQTPNGVKAKGYMDKGELVPPEIVLELIKDRLSERDCKNGYVLDGYPRSGEQARSLEKITIIDRVIYLAIDFDLLIQRLSGRRVCKDCGQIYHISVHRDKGCAKCGGELMQRADDREETVKNRLEIYTKETEPLIKYYKQKNILFTVDAAQGVENVAEDINAVLKKVK
jgi:adenylate kinase